MISAWERDGNESRTLRDRQAERDALDDRDERKPPAMTTRMLVQVVDQGAMPTAPFHYWATNPVGLDGPECEGCTGTPTPDASTTYMVDFIRGTPSVGDYAVAYGVGGRWVAEVGSPCPPSNSCQWFCPCDAAGNPSIPPFLWVTIGCPAGTLGPFKVPLASGDINNDCEWQLITAIPFGGSTNCPAVAAVPFGIAITNIGSGIYGVQLAAYQEYLEALPPCPDGTMFSNCPVASTVHGIQVAFESSYVFNSSLQCTSRPLSQTFAEDWPYFYAFTENALGLYQLLGGDCGKNEIILPLTFTVSEPSASDLNVPARCQQGCSCRWTCSALPIAEGGSVTISGGGGSGATAFASVGTNGTIVCLTIIAGGHGYTSNPTVTIADPATGANVATASAGVADGVVTSLCIKNPGSGYGQYQFIPAQLQATIASPGGTYGPFTLDIAGADTKSDGTTWCWWSCESTVNFGGSSICPAAAVVPVILSYHSLTGILGFTCGYGQAGYNCTPQPQVPGVNCGPGADYECPSGSCPGNNEGFVVGASFNTSIGFLMPACTERPYMGTIEYEFGIGLALATTTTQEWALFGGDCDSPPVPYGLGPTFSVTLSEVVP